MEKLSKKLYEKPYLHKAVLNKTMTTQEWCVKYDFVAPLNSVMYLAFIITISEFIFCTTMCLFVAGTIITTKNLGLHETTKFTARLLLKRS